MLGTDIQKMPIVLPLVPSIMINSGVVSNCKAKLKVLTSLYSSNIGTVRDDVHFNLVSNIVILLFDCRFV